MLPRTGSKAPSAKETKLEDHLGPPTDIGSDAQRVVSPTWHMHCRKARDLAFAVGFPKIKNR